MHEWTTFSGFLVFDLFCCMAIKNKPFMVRGVNKTGFLFVFFRLLGWGFDSGCRDSFFARSVHAKIDPSWTCLDRSQIHSSSL